ncbi:hypothetical protein predicted by Glimmer/Critica [Bdellovibrio bacteriovorus HD100]|uniref:Uncharacterized protein n=1 Tax=Bdellovibrio bacteriovorus (strain ATCC 15356 / DSM 50701 / NCIMB 9529 / HD100) TaxID=264462 RepID=Q6MNJ7_BDEBA|nr:hypothetical protein predicted by Glimmer/Critica [Bdellovibrio bacteriovorus HD100]
MSMTPDWRPARALPAEGRPSRGLDGPPPSGGSDEAGCRVSRSAGKVLAGLQAGAHPKT